MKTTIIATSLMALSINAFAGSASQVHTYNRNLDDVYEYTKQVHGYSHGNSIAIQYQGKQIKNLEQNKVDKTEFYADQQRQDKHINAVQNAAQVANERSENNSVRLDKTEGAIRETNAQLEVTDKRSINNAERLDGHGKSIDALNSQADSINQTLNNHGDVLSNHQNQIDSMQSTMGQQINSAMNRANQAYKEARIAQDMASAALAVAGHQYDLNYNGIQTAVSVASFGRAAALSVGVGGKLNDRVFVNGAVTSAGSATGGVVSGTYKW